MNKKTNFHSFETYGIVYGGSQTFYGGFETYDILWRF